MDEENISQEFRLENIGETEPYFTEELDLNDITCKKHKKVCIALNYIEHLIILDSSVTAFVY